MTLSYLETKSAPRIRPAPRGLPKTMQRLAAARTELRAAYAEVTSAPHFAPALLRVASALTLGFGLVHLVKGVIN